MCGCQTRAAGSRPCASTPRGHPAGVLAAVLPLLIWAPAYAQPPVTTTTHEKGLVETFVDVVTSEGGGPLHTITTTSNLVSKEIVFDDGRIHAAFTQTGSFVAEPLENPSLPSFTKFTVGRVQPERQDRERHFRLTVHGKGSDGSTFRVHTTEHFNARPDGTVNEFVRCHD